MRRLTLLACSLIIAILTGCNLDFITGRPCVTVLIPIDTAYATDPITGDTVFVAVSHRQECR